MPSCAEDGQSHSTIGNDSQKRNSYTSATTVWYDSTGTYWYLMRSQRSADGGVFAPLLAAKWSRDREMRLAASWLLRMVW